MAHTARRRRLLQALAAAGAFGPAGISGLIREALAEGDKPVKPGMQRITGTVTVNGKAASEGMLLRAGDTIATGPKSEAIYVIGQDAYLQREKSSVSFAASAAGTAADVMRVITGGILSVFGKGAKRLEVPTATIGIRGTGCYIETQGEKSVYFCLCYGIADVAPLADPKVVERIETRYHDHPILIHNDAAMPTMAPHGVINHTDSELVLLENLVGRWPPFYGKSGFSGY